MPLQVIVLFFAEESLFLVIFSRRCRYCDIYVSMHRVLEVMSGHGWRLDQLFHTNALLPSGMAPCNVLIFSRNMTLGARPPSMHFALEGVDEDALLVRGYTASTVAGRRNTDVAIGADGEILRGRAVQTSSPIAE